MASAYAERIAWVLKELGIPEDYGKVHSMALQTEAETLAVGDRDPDGFDIRLIPSAAWAWAQLKEAAARDLMSLVAVSGFRSVERQSILVRRKLEAGLPIEAILRYIAAPGYSEHHTGRAIDVGAAGQPLLSESFEITDQFQWLSANAARFGYRLSYPKNNHHGMGYEPWHWCFIS